MPYIVPVKVWTPSHSSEWEGLSKLSTGTVCLTMPYISKIGQNSEVITLRNTEIVVFTEE